VPSRGRFALLGAVGVALVLASLARPAAAAEPIGWSQFQGDAAHSGVGPENGPLPPYRQAWTFEEPESNRGLSAAVISGDVAIAVGVEGVYAVDLGSGAQRWSVPRAGGPLAAPALGTVDGRTVLVYTEGEDDESSTVVGVDVAKEEELWRTDLEDVSRSGVTIDAGMAFLGDDSGTVYAVDLASGEPLWTLERQGQILSPPAAGGGAVFAPVSDAQNGRVQVTAVDADTGPQDGNALWTFEPAVAGRSLSTPTLGPDSLVVGVSERLLVALDLEDGRPLWEERLNTESSQLSAPAASDVVVAGDLGGGLYAVRPATGEREWSYQLNELNVRSSPVVVGGYTVVGLQDGRLVAIDLATAELVWESPPGSGAIGAIAVAGDALIAARGSEQGGLVAFVEDPDGELSHVASPTVLDLPVLIGSFAAAFAAVSVVLWGLGRLLLARFPLETIEPANGVEDGLEEDR
jgi:outer membrane protein assembly factor BamB